MKKLALLLSVIFSVLMMTSGFADNYTVTNTNDNGAGSLRQAIADAAGNGAIPHSITFNIPVGSTITLQSDLVITGGNLQGLTINGFIDGTAGPDVIIRGNGTRNHNLEIRSVNNVKIYGIVFQNMEHGVRITNSSNNTEIKGCYFGTNLAGTAVVDGIQRSGISINGGSGHIIGGLSFISSSAGGNNNPERNLFAGCMYLANNNYSGDVERYGAVRIENSGSNLIQNNYFGTDITGTVHLGNGGTFNSGSFKMPLDHHNIYIKGNSTSNIIDRNLISGATGVGIYLESGCSNTKIKGNKIGTDAAGTGQIPNEAAGIYMEAVTNVLVGYDGGNIAEERNIISGNGGAQHNNYVDNCHYGWNDFNQYGIYCKNITSCSFKGNYIGTDITGNSNDAQNFPGVDQRMGNRAGGIKIVSQESGGGASQNIIGGTTANERNIISGNGDIWGSVVNSPQCGAASPSAITGGPGITLQYETCANNTIIGNYIGIGADGITQLGNKLEGVNILGAKNNTIGGATPGAANYICNNLWGVMLQIDFGCFWNGSSCNNAATKAASGNIIIGNSIGVAPDNTTIMGNGTRPTDGEGGGISLQLGANGNYIGGTNTGEGNVISGNKSGIVIRNQDNGTYAKGGANGNFIYNNRIGVDLAGAVALPNLNYGIHISGGARNNTIGSTAANGRNIISGNTSHGIFLENGDENSFFNNYIGLSATATQLPNGGDGIRIASDAGTTTPGSISNIIGGPVAGQGNTIAYNTGNGINILDAASNQNSISRNSIYCNGLRGIELNGLGNDNFPAPVILNISTATTLKGKARPNSLIELFATDECNPVCSYGTSQLEGKRYIASVISAADSSWSYTYQAADSKDFRNYTATASSVSAIPGTASAYNTSEFSTCVSVCTPPATVSISAESSTTICAGGTLPKLTAVTSGGVRPFTYQWSNANGNLNGATDSTYTPTQAGSYTVTVFGVGGVCSTASAATQVVVNDTPNVVSVVPSNPAICSGDSAQLVTSVTPAGTYSYAWTASNGFSAPGNEASPWVKPTTTTSQVSVTYTLVVTNTATGCVSSSESATVTVNPLSDSQITTSGPTTFCDGGSVTLTATAGQSTYQWIRNGSENVGTNSNTYSAAQSGSYTVIVTTPAGCSTVTVTPVTVTVNPNPVVTLTPSASEICLGQSATLNTSVSGSSATPFDYQWTATPGTVPAGESPVITPLSATTYNYTLKVVDANTCESNVASASVIVNPKPDSTISVSGDTVFCEGGSITLSAPAGAGYTYEWKLGNTVVSTDQSLVVDKVNQSGKYTVKVNTNKACSAVSDTQTVIVNPNPDLTLDPNGNTNGCVGQTLTLRAASGYQVIYNWFKDDNAIVNTSDSLVVSTDGEYKVTASIPATGCFTSDSAIVTFRDNNFSGIVTASPAFCESDSLLLTATDGGAGAKYQWFDTDGNEIPGATKGTYYAKAAGSYSVYIELAAGCKDTSDAVAIIMYDKPDANAIAGNPEICLDDEVEITATVTDGTAPYNYVWTNTKTTAVITETPVSAGTHIYKVTVTDANQCTDTASASVIVNSRPSVNVTANPSPEICMGESTGLNAAASGGTGAFTYTWTPAIGLSGTNIPNPVASPVDTTNYKVVVTDEKDCASDTASLIVIVHENPTISASANDTEICEGEPVTVSATVITGASPFNYSWDNGQTAGSFTDTPGDTITYVVTVTDAHNCSSASAPVTVNVNPNPYDSEIGAAGDTIFCEGGSVQLSVVNVDANATYTWHRSGTQVGAGDSYTADTSGTYTVRATYPSTLCYTNLSDAVTVIEHANPDTVVIDAIGDTIFCEGGSVEMVVNPVQSGAVYNWFYIDNPDVEISQGTSVTVDSTGDYTVVASITYGTLVCKTAGNDTVSVIENKKPFVPQIQATGPNIVCQGDSVIIKVTNVESGAQYIWKRQPSTVLSDTEDSLVVKISGTYTVAALFPVSTCSTDASGSVTVTITDNPQDFTVFAEPDNEICEGETATLRASVTYPAGTSYTWYEAGNPNVSIGNNAFYYAQDSGSYGLKVIFDLPGGKQCITESDNTVGVLVNKNPAVALTSNYSDTAICIGSPVELYAITGDGKPEKYNFYWSIHSIDDDTVGVTITHLTDTIYVEIEDKITKCSASAGKRFKIKGAYVDIILDTMNLCLQSTKHLDVYLSTSSLSYTYEWSFENDPLKYTSNVPYIDSIADLYVTGTAVGNEWYYLTVKDDLYKCEDKDSVFIKVFGLPLVSLSSDKDTVCVGTEVVLNAKASEGNPYKREGISPYLYDWAMLDTIASVYYPLSAELDDTTVSVYPTVSPMVYYHVTVTDSIGCRATDTIKLYPLPEQVLNIPNLITPNNDGKNDVLFITDNYGLEIFSGATIEIYNRWGQAVFKSNNYDNNWKAENCTDGVYYYNLKAGCGATEHKGWLHIIANENN